YDDAEALLTSIYNQASGDKVKATALYKLAYSYQNNNKENEAITKYDELLTQYPTTSDKAAALEALRNMYILNGQPERFLAFVKQNNLPTPDESIIELTYYDAALAEFNKENYQHALIAFNTYLDKYPNGLYSIQSNYFSGAA